MIGDGNNRRTLTTEQRRDAPLPLFATRVQPLHPVDAIRPEMLEQEARVRGAEARALLEYIGALERDGNGWRSVAAVRQERIVELERERG